MARAHHDRRTPGDWLRGLFRQPPPGRFTVYGSGLRICTLTAARLTVQGQFLRTDFSDE